MPPAHRVGDKAMNPADAHGCPVCPHPVQGPGTSGSPDVFVNNMPQMRVGDPGMHAACCGPNSWTVAQGSSSVFVNNIPPSRIGDATSHCGGSGKVIQGSPNVIIGDYTCAPPPPPPEPPPVIPRLVEAWPKDARFFVNLPDDEGRKQGRKVTVKAKVDPPQGGVPVFFKLLDIAGNAQEFEEASQKPRLLTQQATTNGSGEASAELELSQVAGDQIAVRASSEPDGAGTVADTGLQAVWRKLAFDVTVMHRPPADQPFGSGFGLRSKKTYEVEEYLKRTKDGLAKMFIEFEDSGERHTTDYVPVLRSGEETKAWAAANLPGRPSGGEAPQIHIALIGSYIAIDGKGYGALGMAYDRDLDLRHEGGGVYGAELSKPPYVNDVGVLSRPHDVMMWVERPGAPPGSGFPNTIDEPNANLTVPFLVTPDGELGTKRVKFYLQDLPARLRDGGGYPNQLTIPRFVYYEAITVDGYCPNGGQWVIVVDGTDPDVLLHEIGHALGLCGETVTDPQPSVNNHCVLTSCVMYMSSQGDPRPGNDFHGGATPARGTCAHWLRRLNMSKDHLYTRWWDHAKWPRIMTEADAEGCPCGD